MNQFSKALLHLKYNDETGWLWTEAAEIVPMEHLMKPMKFSNTLTHSMNVAEEKATFMCFIIALSDEDLFEMFEIPLPEKKEV